MDLLDRLLAHDAWTTRRLLELCRPLTDEQLDRDFGLGPGTVRATVEHMIYNMEAWSDEMGGRAIRPRGGRSVGELVARLDSAAADLARVARDVRARGAWDEPWTVPDAEPPKRHSLGGTIAHVITHSMHHRAQVLFMLRRLGVEDVPEGDVLGWEGSAGLFE